MKIASVSNSTVGYGEGHIDFQVSDDGRCRHTYQATLVLGKKRLGKLLFKDLSHLQRFLAICQEGVRILPPRWSPKWTPKSL